MRFIEKTIDQSFIQKIEKKKKFTKNQIFMGANGSSVEEDAAIVAAGYETVGDPGPFVIKDFDTQKREKNEEKWKKLMKTPFHATMKKITTNTHSIEPIYGQCYAYSKEKETLFVAFGELGNKRMNRDLIVYDARNKKFSIFMKNIGEGRVHSSMVLENNFLYIFGGNNDSKYLSEFIRIDTETKEIVKLPMEGENAPCPRSSAVIGHNNGKIIIWGGNNGLSIDGAIHVFDTKTNEWIKHETYQKTRFEPGYVQKGKNIYIFGSSEKHGLMRLDTEAMELINLNETGTKPQNTVSHPSLVCCGDYLLCFGGTSNFLYSHLFAYDIEKNWWFVFHIKPDESTIDIGEITDLGLFKFPRQDSQASFYNESERSVYFMFGNRMEDHVPVYEFDLGKALTLLNERKDLIDMLY